jgi:CDP-4-dehydro-6-deoxyglucose reductase, E1
MRVFYAEANYGDEEIDAAIKILKEGRLALMCGQNVLELEAVVAKLFQQ